MSLHVIPRERLLWVQLPRPPATFGLVVLDGYISDAAPIGAHVIGWDARRAVAHFRGRGGRVTEVHT